MAEAEHSADAVGEPPRGAPRALDDFITSTEIEQKLGQVVKPGATAKPARSSPNWRWGILAAVIGFGALRAVFSSGGHSSQIPTYTPPQQRPMHFGIQEVKRDVEENRRAQPPIWDDFKDKELQQRIDDLRRTGGDPKEIRRLETDLERHKAVRDGLLNGNIKVTEKEGTTGPQKP